MLVEVEEIVADTSRTSHERYSTVYKVIRERDRELARAFDDPRRSTALLQLAMIQRQQLLNDEELSRFSPETHDAVQSFLAISEK